LCEEVVFSVTENDRPEAKIYMPTEAATATAPSGRKLVFFTVPQLELLIKNVIAARPGEYTYRWAYHSSQRVHVLLFSWPGIEETGIAIPEGAGDPILHYMQGTSDLFITLEPVQEKLQGKISAEAVEAIVLGNTVGLPDVKFKPEG
jgi:hypothetical protein